MSGVDPPKAGMPTATLAAVEIGRGIVIQASNMEARIMRYELSDNKWAMIRPILPNKGQILHGHDAVSNRKLLEKTYAALAPGGVVAIAEFLVEPDRSGPLVGLIFAANMLVNTEAGNTYSFEEVHGWLKDAGFEQVRTLDVPGPSPLILATRPL